MVTERKCLKCHRDLSDVMGVHVFVTDSAGDLKTTDYLLCVDDGAGGRNGFSAERLAALVERFELEGRIGSASKSAGVPADMWASGDAGGSADKWDGVQVDLLDSFTTGEGDRVARIQVRGVPLIIFAYKDQSPQVIQYPNGQRSIHAFNMYKESLEN